MSDDTKDPNGSEKDHAMIVKITRDMTQCWANTVNDMLPNCDEAIEVWNERAC